MRVVEVFVSAGAEIWLGMMLAWPYCHLEAGRIQTVLVQNWIDLTKALLSPFCKSEKIQFCYCSVCVCVCVSLKNYNLRKENCKKKFSGLDNSIDFFRISYRCRKFHNPYRNVTLIRHTLSHNFSTRAYFWLTAIVEESSDNSIDFWQILIGVENFTVPGN